MMLGRGRLFLSNVAISLLIRFLIEANRSIAALMSLVSCDSDVMLSGFCSKVSFPLAVTWNLTTF